jgi:rsbT co-antagonist protein RsbR
LSIVAGLAWFAPSVEVEQVIIGDALPLVSGIGFVTLLVIIWLLSDRLLTISDAAVALADKRAAEAEDARQHAEEAQSTIARQYAEQQRLLDLVSVLETPVIAIAEGVLLAPIVGHLDSRRAGQLTQRLLDAVYAQRARAVIIDIAGVPLVDTQVAQLLIRTAQSIRLLGSRVALTGISSETAMTLSSLGDAPGRDANRAQPAGGAPDGDRAHSQPSRLMIAHSCVFDLAAVMVVEQLLHSRPRRRALPRKPRAYRRR